jgi:hypothetical protein
VVQSEAGNVLVRKTDVVQDLERRLVGMEQQRDALGGSSRTSSAAQGAWRPRSELEKKFRAMADERGAGAPPLTVPPATLPQTP